MKTIEEKAKAYDEALALMQDCIPDENGLVHIRPEDIFPKLAESEDERIELLNYLYDVHDDDEERARWIAWLEKQGEQKPKRMVSAEAKEAMYDKPAWSEEDETGLHDAYNIVSDFNNSIPEEPVIEDILDMSKIDYKIQYASVESGIHAYAETYSFNIESQLFNQLKKEQQGLWRKEIEQAVINGGHWGVDLAKDKRYKENQEPVEWSEKDEEIRTALIKYLGSSDSLSVDLASAICWLKSLKDRYTWKPSSEQMNALVQASVTGVPGHKEALESLINDLKKIREE